MDRGVPRQFVVASPPSRDNTHKATAVLAYTFSLYRYQDCERQPKPPAAMRAISFGFRPIILGSPRAMSLRLLPGAAQRQSHASVLPLIILTDSDWPRAAARVDSGPGAVTGSGTWPSPARAARGGRPRPRKLARRRELEGGRRARRRSALGSQDERLQLGGSCGPGLPVTPGRQHPGQGGTVPAGCQVGAEQLAAAAGRATRVHWQRHGRLGCVGPSC